MKIKLFVAAVCILALPICFAPSAGDKLINSTPFATVAMAGHTIVSNAPCTCGCPNCICDAGEEPQQCSKSVAPVADNRGGGRAARGKSPAADFNFGAGAMLLALAFFAWARFRA